MTKRNWLAGPSPSLTPIEVTVLRTLIDFHFSNDEPGHGYYNEAGFNSLMEKLFPELLQNPHERARAFMAERAHIGPPASLDEWLTKHMDKLSASEWVLGWAIVEEC